MRSGIIVQRKLVLLHAKGGQFVQNEHTVSGPSTEPWGTHKLRDSQLFMEF